MSRRVACFDRRERRRLERAERRAARQDMHVSARRAGQVFDALRSFERVASRELHHLAGAVVLDAIHNEVACPDCGVKTCAQWVARLTLDLARLAVIAANDSEALEVAELTASSHASCKRRMHAVAQLARALRMSVAPA